KWHGPQTRLGNSAAAADASAVTAFAETPDRLIDAAQRLGRDFEEPHVEIGGIAIIGVLDERGSRAVLAHARDAVLKFLGQGVPARFEPCAKLVSVDSPLRHG